LIPGKQARQPFPRWPAHGKDCTSDADGVAPPGSTHGPQTFADTHPTGCRSGPWPRDPDAPSHQARLVGRTGGLGPGVQPTRRIARVR
jgi:hypothetical protein